MKYRAFLLLMVLGLGSITRLFAADLFYVNTNEGLNLRAEPSLQARVIMIIPFLAKVTVNKRTATAVAEHGFSGLWLQVEWQGNSGWACSLYLVKTQPATAHDTFSYTAFLVARDDAKLPFFDYYGPRLKEFFSRTLSGVTSLVFPVSFSLPADLLDQYLVKTAFSINRFDSTAQEYQTKRAQFTAKIEQQTLAADENIVNYGSHFWVTSLRPSAEYVGYMEYRYETFLVDVYIAFVIYYPRMDGQLKELGQRLFEYDSAAGKLIFRELSRKFNRYYELFLAALLDYLKL